MNLHELLESAQCVKINLDNMVKMMPALRQHPLLPLVQDQAQECITKIEQAIEEEED